MERGRFLFSTTAIAAMAAVAFPKCLIRSALAADDSKPNIVVIMGDDIGVWNIGAYNRGMMAGSTPNLDQVAAERRHAGRRPGILQRVVHV